MRKPFLTKERLRLSKNLRFSDSFSVLLVPRKLETAQNRKVWAARAKPVLPTNYISGFIDSLSLSSQRRGFSVLTEKGGRILC